nr:MAK10-like protein [Tanacetum cinerariifolium]
MSIKPQGAPSIIRPVVKSRGESLAFIEDLALYENKSWNDTRDLAKPVKAISLPQDVSSTFYCRLIELENQVQRLMEAHLAPKPSVQVNKIASLCEICSVPTTLDSAWKISSKLLLTTYSRTSTKQEGNRLGRLDQNLTKVYGVEKDSFCIFIL